MEDYIITEEKVVAGTGSEAVCYRAGYCKAGAVLPTANTSLGSNFLEVPSGDWHFYDGTSYSVMLTVGEGGSSTAAALNLARAAAVLNRDSLAETKDEAEAPTEDDAETAEEAAPEIREETETPEPDEPEVEAGDEER